MILSAIAALAANRVIGKSGDLPWRLPEDLKFFREKTSSSAMIMGRKTYESLPNGKPLPGRLHIVITRQPDYEPEGSPANVITVRSFDEAVAEARARIEEWGQEVFVIGGGEIFRESLPHLNRMYLTEIHRDYEGDAHFPEWPRDEFWESERTRREGPGGIAFDFVTYERRG